MFRIVSKNSSFGLYRDARVAFPTVNVLLEWKVAG
jgi:hypothetical protein